MAVVGSQAQIGLHTQIADTAVIGDDVVIGSNCTISDFVVIRDGTRIGDNCKIYSHVVIGEDPQDKNYNNEKTFVRIGNNNVLREFVTVHRAVGAAEATTIGDDNYLMVGVHVAHNSKIGSNITLANGVTMGGHVEIHDHANVGGMAVIHQMGSVGTYAMLGGMSAANHDIVPYCVYSGNPSKAVSTNRYAMKNAGFDQALRSEIMRAYKIIYGEQLSMPSILDKLENELRQYVEIKQIINFIKNSKRGIVLKSGR